MDFLPKEWVGAGEALGLMSRKETRQQWSFLSEWAGGHVSEVTGETERDVQCMLLTVCCFQIMARNITKLEKDVQSEFGLVAVKTRKKEEKEFGNLMEA